MPRGLRAALGELLTPRGDTGRVLLTGWFSFRHGEVTAGDALGQRSVPGSLGQLGVRHDTAWSPVYAPGELSLDAAFPENWCCSSAGRPLGVPVLVVDPVEGGAKVSAQAEVRWPVLPARGALSPRALDACWDWCLPPAGVAAAHDRRTRVAQHV
ncbi:hypothetical protein [Streptomyces sp. NPDC102437]|uniref:hypothetical protein n=1 Tax=Streptomyces sp. NPDC102437 TaxID=3366175 RepID=UPI0037F8569E